MKKDERPIINRNKSFVEIGRDQGFRTDSFRKDSVDRSILQRATES